MSAGVDLPRVDEKRLWEKMSPNKKEANEVLKYVARKAKVRFLADENFPARPVEVLREMGAKAVTLQKVGTRRHPDENHAAYALREGLILLTCDRDFLDKRKFPQRFIALPFSCSTSGAERNGRFGRHARARRSCSRLKWCKFDAGRDSWTATFRYQNRMTSRSRFRLLRGRIQEWVDRTEAADARHL